MKNRLLTALTALGLSAFAPEGRAQCVLFSETFDNSLGAFTPTGSNNGAWVHSTSCAQNNAPGHSAPGAAMFIGSGCFFGNASFTVSGFLNSPAINIPATGTYVLTFNYYLNTECGNVFSDCLYDVLWAQISTDGINFTTVASSAQPGQLPMNGAWNSKQINLAAYAGQTIYIRFRFNSVDGFSNNLDGIYVDDVFVRKVTPGPVNTVSGPFAFCQGESVTLTSSSAFNNLWSNGATTQTITVSAPGTYTLSTSEGPNCIPAGSSSITVYQKPLSQAVSDFDTSVCVGANLPLTAHISGSQTGQYFWYESATSPTVVHQGQTLPAQTYNADKTWYVEFRDSIPGKSGKYYLRTNLGEPWSFTYPTANLDRMNAAFGSGNWTSAFFETVNVSAMLADAAFIYIDGSDNGSTPLANFLAANLPALEDWVSSGGNLFLNSAPNSGGNINFGFGGTTLVYPNMVTNAVAAAPGHPIFNSPSPAGSSFSGTQFAHAIVTGSGYNKLIVNQADTSQMILGLKSYGAGRIMVGGMTISNFHSPQPQANNLRSNILTFMYQAIPPGLSDCPSDRAEISVNVGPEVSYNQDQTVCLQAGALTLQGGTPAGGTYTIGGNPATQLIPANAGVGPVTVIYSYTDGQNCTASDTSVITVVDCTGIQEAGNGASISVYPNPSNGLLNVDAKGVMIQRVEVLSVTGQLVYAAEVNQSASQLNLGELGKGVYLLRVTHENGSFVRRIVLK